MVLETLQKALVALEVEEMVVFLVVTAQMLLQILAVAVEALQMVLEQEILVEMAVQEW